MGPHRPCNDMLPQAENLLRTIAGEETGWVPRQELFFNNPRIVQRVLGRPPVGDFREELDFACEIGWGSVRATSWGARIGARNETASDGTSHYAGGSAIEMSDLDQLRGPDLDLLASTYGERASLVRGEGLLVHLFMLHCFHSAATGLGMERLCLMVYDQPELLAEYMRRVEAINREALAAVLSTGIVPDIAIFDVDCSFKTAMMVSPAAYRELIFEPTAATARMLHDAAIIMLMHTDGRIDEVYPVWLEMGVAGAHGVEAQANDLGEVKALFGSRMTLFGNFDPVILATERPRAIRALAREMVETGRSGGRYVAAVNTIVGDHVPVENYLAMIEGVDEAARA